MSAGKRMGATDPAALAAQITTLEAQAATEAAAGRAIVVTDQATAARQIGHERIAQSTTQQATALRAQLEVALEVQAQATLSTAADNTIATMATKDAAVTAAVTAAKSAIASAAATITDRDHTAAAQASALQDHLYGTQDTPRVTAGRAGTTVDGKSLGPIGPGAFVAIAQAVASLADQVGAAGYGDALRNAARVLPAYHTPFA